MKYWKYFWHVSAIFCAMWVILLLILCSPFFVLHISPLPFFFSFVFAFSKFLFLRLETFLNFFRKQRKTIRDPAYPYYRSSMFAIPQEIRRTSNPFTKCVRVVHSTYMYLLVWACRFLLLRTEPPEAAVVPETRRAPNLTRATMHCWRCWWW